MCGGIIYQYRHGERRDYYPDPEAKLPVVMKSGEVWLYPWGRREDENGRLPMTGWARLESIKGGKWRRYRPKPVKIPLRAFMEKDCDGTAHWFDMSVGTWVQGLLAGWDNERRVYVVTIRPTGALGTIHSRWPRIVGAVDAL